MKPLDHAKVLRIALECVRPRGVPSIQDGLSLADGYLDLRAKAAAVDSLYDAEHDVVCLRTRVADGLVEHKSAFLKLRAAIGR